MTTKKPGKRVSDRYALNEIEAAIEPHEKSWVDFLYAVRLGRRHIRSEQRRETRARGLLIVHRILEGYRDKVIAGNRLSIWTALILCIEENVPLPYWLGDAILDIHKTVNKEPSNLHELFGMESRLPAQGKRAHNARTELQWRWELSSEVNALIAELGMSKDAAIKKVRADLRVPYSQRKCRTMCDEQERIDREHSDSVEGRRTISRRR